MTQEVPISFSCNSDRLYGMLHLPEKPQTRGVLVVVGGPQYRVGSHRQFVLLARALAEADIPVMRFDYRGMGDSDGEPRTFEQVNADIRVAIDQFFNRLPDLREIVLWGLCDAASAALFYAHTDPRVTGLVLANPWIRMEASAAKAYLKHYYFFRLFDPGLWRKIARGEFNILASAISFWRMILTSLGLVPTASSQKNHRNALPQGSVDAVTAETELNSLPARMLQGVNAFKGHLLFILSGDDLTAGEFKDTLSGSRAWRKSLKSARVTRRDLPGANHTFSRREWRDQVASWTQEWVKSW
jgi:exosortase A-associated hydrolase 1